MSIHKAIALVLMVLGLTACATKSDMGVTGDTKKLKLDDKALVLLTVGLSHAYKPGRTLHAWGVHSVHPVAEGKDRKNFFSLDKGSTSLEGDMVWHYVRLMVEPGKLVIRGFPGRTDTGFFNTGYFFFPLHLETSVKAGEVVYLGRIHGTTREREEEEFRTGPVTPLLPQSLSGMSGSTFDIEVQDEYERDITFMKAAYPALSDVDVIKRILPEFDRIHANSWWNDNCGNFFLMNSFRC